MTGRGLLVLSLPGFFALASTACRTNYDGGDQNEESGASGDTDAGDAETSMDAGPDSGTSDSSSSSSSGDGDDTSSGDGDSSSDDTSSGDGDAGSGGDGDTGSVPECGDGQHEPGELCFLAYGEHDLAHDLESIDARDMTGDGRPDVVGVLATSDQVLSIVNQGDGTFANGSPHTAAAGTQNYDIVVMELDQDAAGHPDILFANNGFSQATMVSGDGSGDLAAQEYASDYWYMGPMRTFEVVDLNGDDFEDVLSGVGSGAMIASLGQAGGGLTHPLDPNEVPDHAGCGAADIIPARMGAAGLTPFLVCEDLGEVHEWRVQGSMSNDVFLQDTYSVGMAPTGGDHCDLDGNNYDDIVVSVSGEDEVAILFFDVNGMMSAAQLDVGSSPQAVRCVDMNNDGHEDIVTVNDGGLGEETVTILLGEGDGGFQLSPVTLELNMANPRDPRDMEVQDFNGDGSPDIVIAFAYHNETQQQEPALGVILSNP